MFARASSEEPLPGKRLILLRYYWDSWVERWMRPIAPVLHFTVAAGRVGKRDAELAVMFRDYSARQSHRRYAVYQSTLGQLCEDVAEWQRVRREEFVAFVDTTEAKDDRDLAETLFESRVDQHDSLLLRYLYAVESDQDVLGRFNERWMTMLADDVGQAASDAWLQGGADPLPILKKMTALAQDRADKEVEVLKKHPEMTYLDPPLLPGEDPSLRWAVPSH